MAIFQVLSENGWPVLVEAPPAEFIPGTTIKLRVRPGDVATILLDVAARFHREVEHLDLNGEPDEWGWANRNVRGSTTTISNHASGTAIDLNATRHPRGVKGTFSPAEKAVVRKVLRRYHDPRTGHSVVRWGEDYIHTIDGMHFEIFAGSEAVHRVAERIRAEAKHVLTEEDEVQLTDKVKLTAKAAAAIGSELKEGDEVSVQYLLQWSPLVRRSAREAEARDADIVAKIDALSRQVATLTAQLAVLSIPKQTPRT